jgi:tRNA (mo5U34)-methyltransferase
MRSKELNLDCYNTDKIAHSYLDVYDPIFAPWVNKEIKLLEIGVREGGSLQLWRDYFQLGIIIGIDIKLPEQFVPGERIQIFEGSQSDKQFLSEVANKVAPEAFDIIIDDASHIGTLTKTAFWHLFDNHLKPGGLYAIEDWGTGYLEDFPDGKRLDAVNPPVPTVQSLSPGASDASLKVPFPCHSHGMVGFIKELVDEQGAADVTMGRPGGERRASRFTQLIITPCIVFVRKMAPILNASPNPVPASEGLGRTTISWNSVDGKIYVAEGGRDEVLFADSPGGSQEVDWIGEASSYDFRLYNSDRTKLLDKVIVAKAAAVNASPNPVPPSEGLGRTTISWDSVDGKIYVAESGRDEVLFADSPRGSQEVDWIGEASSYDFRLYNSDRAKLLDRVIVTKAAASNAVGRISQLSELAHTKEQELWKIKLACRPKPFWYPYSTLQNVAILEKLSAAAGFQLLELCRGVHGKVADIGAADGDLAFFLERQGLLVDVIDNEHTNFNALQGARILKEALDSSVDIRSVDLDSQFSLTGEKYDAVFFLGTLYHLKNPFFLLERLARITKYCFVSTRIAKQTADGQSLSSYPVAYLVGPQECNDDDTNFWIFSDHGLKRLVDRTGWTLLSYVTIGDTATSTPVDPDRDERAFCLLEKRPPLLRVDPNPVPASKGAGKTTIYWDTCDGTIGKVYASMKGDQETLFAHGRRGSARAEWIKTGFDYEFRLYNSGHTELLAKVAVTTTAQQPMP